MQTLVMSKPEAPHITGFPATVSDFHHNPVLLEEVLALVPPAPELLVDATLGGGGHAEALLEKFPAAELFGSDRDPQALAASTGRLSGFRERIQLKQLPFSDLHHHLLVGSVDFLLADLGVSSPQLDTASRGFSFTREGPLDMRMDPIGTDTTAGTLVNNASQEELKDILYRLGEERFTPRIVRAIIEARSKEPVKTTAMLADIISQAVPARFHRKGHHPATKSFQALRMSVNQELEELESLLHHALDILKPGGRIVVISFHSLEDRLLKKQFNKWEKPCECPPKLPRCICGKVTQGKRLTRKPVTAGEKESSANPRSRSAKLRAFEKK